MHQPAIAVIIPYYQRRSGILRRCVASILAQRTTARIHIVVIDDGSPAPASDEVAALPATSLTLIRQPNAGPGAARNAALDHLPAGTELVALMDSDDGWEPDFLDTALKALSGPFDLFFADSQRYGIEATRFGWSRDASLNLRPGQHPLVDPERQIHAFAGDFFDFALRRSNIMGPSTLVYRYSACPRLRFDTSLYNGQDRLFKLHLCKRLARVAFSTRVLAREGEGVNIFDSASWGSARALSFVSSYIRLSRAILRELELDPAQRRHVLDHLGRSRAALAANLVHGLAHRKPLDWRALGAALRADPTSGWRLPLETGRLLAARLAARARAPALPRGLD
ncbi:MAG: glycosyltransferase family 2 protein [Chromatiaceae bacterium]|nr:glycosyltransferase family 2 protein [Chromatiaceae bacterium]